ncbi:hypothetical protein, partial [Roseobacter sp. HKCCD6507]|uniref:hypothetical protein n=1 Tax=Roseobacter sp. HKCCD6507 TaxID=2690581 RepID=UPI001C0EAB79
YSLRPCIPNQHGPPVLGSKFRASPFKMTKPGLFLLKQNQLVSVLIAESEAATVTANAPAG